MARRRRHRRSRRFGDYISVPGFGKFSMPSLKSLNPFGKSVRSTDVIIGALGGLVGGSLLQKYVINKWTSAPAFVQKYAGPLAILGAGAAAMLIMKNKSKAGGFLAGAATVALVPIGWGLISQQFPSLAGYVSYPGALGYPVDVPHMGLLIDAPGQRMAGLAAHAMAANVDEPEYALV